MAGRLDRTVSRRTLERDLQDLSEAGFPLYPERRGRHDFGIVYEDRFVSRIRFSADRAPYNRERLWHPSQRIEELEDGGLVLHLYAGGLYELKPWILSQGAAAEVLEPESLRKEIVAELRALLTAYERKT